ncbi:DUF1566 domain-containing protein [Pseudomonas sp. CCM 7891]|uniref:DUF1566 domain-containing protein n=1 Tax=Pseudomonas karstica TaxID=1055468 RepID=A0A7X2RQJ4_9PSED|nr:DUF1566 domain-containing protein [Pseudomonas karstica]MTD19178.1 DUF1566 domain-containing protein [Pseudomonas karstica]
MKSPLIQIKNLHVSISSFLPEHLASSSSYLEPSNITPAAPVGDELTPPAIGEIWPGQGGIYAGIQQDEDGQQYHKIFADTDVGTFAWGEHGTETAATSKINGVLNTCTLRDTEGSFPAAESAGNYTADGHHDFVLPSIAELNHAWTFVPDSFAKEAYWSSSQRSALSAFTMYFGDGYQDVSVKYYELRVRPVRSLLIR